MEAANGQMLLTADHGNCESCGTVSAVAAYRPYTNLVPLILVNGNEGTSTDGRLADLAPSLLAMMGIDQPLA